MEHQIWFETPAKDWNEAFPVGNGSLGGMVCGGAPNEVIHLNEDTLWFGPDRKRGNPDAGEAIPKIRSLLKEGRIAEAERLSYLALTSSPKYFGAYQPLCDLLIFSDKSEVSGYRRELDLKRAMVRVQFQRGQTGTVRETFVSAPDQVMAVRETNAGGAANIWCTLMRRPFDGEITRNSDGTIQMRGVCGEGGVQYVCMAAGISDGEEERLGDFLSFRSASQTVLLLTAATDFYGEDPEAVCRGRLEKARQKTFEQLLQRHVDDYQSLFHRVTLSLGGEAVSLPTDKRLQRVKQGEKDIGLEELYFNFGRYLMISSSRPGTMAMNLQGIWNHEFRPAWESNYTININTQMNYWPAEVCGLPECHEPLFDLIDRMLPNGRKTAEQVYGCNGFVAHHCTNLWGDTAIEGVVFPSPVWPMGGAWLALHLWEHYRFTGDKEFLERRAYPVLMEAAAFFVDYLTEDDTGFLVTGPTLSPENTYILPDGTEGSLCMGAEMDNQIIRELFQAVIGAEETLGMEDGLKESLTAMLKKIRTPRIGKHGTIMEWAEDYDEKEPGHRHISQLFALYPGTGVHYQQPPEWMEAARKTLARRLENGGGHTGWSCAWIICMYARLMDGAKAHQYFHHLLANSTYSNLLDVHPPFQIDGNMGATAAIAEMLLQSHMDELVLLPALPDEWSRGAVKGLRARGGFTVSISWANGRLEHAEIVAHNGGLCSVRYQEQAVSVMTKPGQTFAPEFK